MKRIYQNNCIRATTRVLVIAGLTFLSYNHSTPARADTTPVIDYAPSTIQNGQNVTINGSGFGTKATATPLIWDDFDSGSPGNLVAGSNPVIGVPWSSTSNPSYSSTIVRPGSVHSVLFDFTGGYDAGYNKFLTTHGAYDEAYFSSWIYLDQQSAQWSSNYKPFTVDGSGTDPDTGQPANYVGFGSPDENDNGSMRDNIIDQYQTINPTMYDGGTQPPNLDGQWVRKEVYLKQSTPNVEDGAYAVAIHRPDDINPPNTNWRLLDNTAKTRTTNNHWWEWFISGAYYCNDSRSPNARANIYEDDVYFDITLARVEIGNASTWNTNTHREIQIPTTWSDGSIAYTVNQGSFNNGEPAFLYVVDENGVVNTTGYPITFAGATGCTPAWDCSDWSVCADSLQTRSCHDDNNCGSDDGRPVETADCDSTAPGAVTDLSAS